MWNRRKVLIQMIRRARRPVGKIELVKWAFILRRETPSAGGSAFYDFVPHHYGPYSFTLAREIQAMTATGHVLERGNAWELGPEATLDPLTPLPRDVAADVARVVDRYAPIPLDRLIDEVYCRHPRYTVNSRCRRLAPRPRARPAVHTAGYERLQVDAFLDMLVRNGIERLLDVRRNPVARRFGFHKATLARLCAALNIEYEHIPELGIPSERRQNLDAPAARAALFDAYERETLSDERDLVETVALKILEKPAVLVCVEADHRDCHRTRLALEVARIVRLPILHLEPAP